MQTLHESQGIFLAVQRISSLLILLVASFGAAAQTNTFPSSGNVGIGTTSPVNALDVGTASIGTFTGTAIAASSNNGVSTVGVGQSQTARGRMKWHYNATEANSFMSLSVSGGLQPLVLQDQGGNVGIGTTNPLATLDIATGTGTNGGINQLRLKTANPTYSTFGRLGVNYDTLYITQNAFYNGTSWIADDTTKRSSQIRLGQYSNSIDFHTSSTVNTPDPPLRLRIDQNGNVGIGSATPAALLHVNGNSGIVTSGSGGILAFQMRDGTAYGGLYGTGNTMRLWRSDVGDVIGINSTGNVGIGTITPAYKFDVQSGQINSSGGLCIAGDCKTAWSQVGSQWGTSGSSINYNSGNIGIGVDSPALQSGTSNKIVEIKGSVNPGVALTSTAAGGRQFYVYSSQTNPGYFSVFDATATADRFVIDSSGRVGIGNAAPASNLQIGTQTAAASATPTTLSLGGTYSNSAGANFKLKLYDDGNAGNTYGIGVSNTSMDFGVSPTAGYHWYSGGTNKMTLTSNGDLSVSGNIAAKYQDVAEWVRSTEQLSPGTVVVLDSTRSNEVIASTQGYDTRVAGVISTRPGITLGENGPNKVLVATTGRVRVKVDASRAPIQIGDLLVTSDIPGLAMKSEAVSLGGVQIHRPGTLIGKALEPLAKGSGEILVLLSLQ